MAARKQTITKFTLAFAVACLLTITPQSLLSQDADQLFQQGVAAGQRGDFSEAESIFRQVTEIDPNNADAYNNLGIALKDQGKLEKAITNYDQAIEIDPNNAVAYYNLGLALRRQGKLEKAIASYEQAIEIDPNNAVAYNNLGIALRNQGQLEKAIASYERAIELDPNYALAYYNLGNALSEQGKLEKAIASYEKAIELNPNDALAYNNLGIALRNQGKLEKAIASYERAIELNPNNADAYNNLGIALRNQGQLEKAIASYERAIEVDPNYALAYNNLGIALRNQGKLEKAIASYERAIELNPNYALAYNNLGYALQQQSRFEEAIQKYQRSLEIDPEHILAKNNLREAERLLAIKLNPPPPDIDDTQHLPTVEDEPLVNTLRSTARIIAQASGEGSSIGAGWVVKKEANKVWIVTNRHVVNDSKTKIPSKKIEVEFFSELPDKDRPRYPATIINSTERNDSLDLAVLEVTGIPDDIKSLELSPGRIRRNTNVVVVGHPIIDEIPWSSEEGKVKSYSPNNSKISMSGTFAQGNSGGPVLNDEHQVIAMMVGIRTDSDIPVSVLDQPNLSIDVNQSATGGVGLAYRIDVVVEKLREWGIISEQ